MVTKSKKRKSSKKKKSEKPKFNKPPVPSKYTKERQDRIVAMIMVGNFPTVAATVAGIDPKTHRKWMAYGEEEIDRLDADPTAEPDPYKVDHVNYFNAVTHAIAFSEARAVDVLRGKHEEGSEPSPDDRKWAAWWLERAKRERWSQSHDVNVHGPNNGPIELKLTEADNFISRFGSRDIADIATIIVRALNSSKVVEESGDEVLEQLSGGSMEPDRSG